MKTRCKSYLTFLILSFLIIHCSLFITYGTVRYVSTTGTSTPPYTTWETAADSIQKCINFSVAGDTIIVANGIYYESLDVDKFLWLIGSSMDSTVIDGANLRTITIQSLSDFNIEGFRIIGAGRTGGFSTIAILNNLSFNINVSNCRISSADRCFWYGNTSGITNNVILSDCKTGVFIFCANDTCRPVITNSFITIDNSIESAISIFDGGNPIITNNIILGNGSSASGIGIAFELNTIIIKNNIVAGFGRGEIKTASAMDTAIVENNVVMYQTSTFHGAIFAGGKANIRNNIVAYNRIGINTYYGTVEEYNLLWQNEESITGVMEMDSTDIIADPMFVNDTFPVYGGNFDFHLQAYSPAIDAGDPNILDVDGTRSDIGVFGGPGGEKYTYQDLAPRPPVNLSAENDSINITLSWNRNTEADFSYYRIYRDTVPGFTIDTTKLISSQLDTFYIQPVPNGIARLVYKLTAVDSQGNESGPSEELIVNITSVGEYPVTISDYILYQNYPNPFNPSTKIGYRLKERGYVKLMVYDIKGELVEVLVNEIKDAGYYETEFSGSRGKEQGINPIGIASGIYIYRIEIIGDRNIPVYSNMKKMLFLK